jgi:hypothetical protein
MYRKLEELNVHILSGRPRNEKDKNPFILLTMLAISLNFIQVLYKTGWIIIKRKKHIWSFTINSFPVQIKRVYLVF